MSTVTVHIVTYNSAEHIDECLQAVVSQTYPIKQIIVIDNNSVDYTKEILRKWIKKCEIVYNSRNNGFAGGHNQAIRMSDSDYCLVLNPDLIIKEDFIERLVASFGFDTQIGSACGKLLLKGNKKQIDSTGLVINKARRAFDRGVHEPEDVYSIAEEVFGVSGAAAMYSREMIDQISIKGQFFDEDFFAYKEDVDIAWRARLMGWKAYFNPKAIGYHERGWKQGERKTRSMYVRRLSYINRYKMIYKNDNLLILIKHIAPFLFYEILSLMYSIFLEPGLLKAWFDFYRKIPELKLKRKMIRSKQRISDSELYSWFI
ncbi:glycosyltransferase family 2 protein [Paenibacillus hexagrammi]|uniref:Glycosyltransferase family 2 protein n=1 Tax=Paenibacillus hexagrammi TaxID=2908839 RepID=A0ABY3SMT6_9BACL|nr:glycosyltransferase family 2 protein [Paenibacillus sp. YPD9-1]UJF34272.1 glycosyltransferase family 2 protein [Paenibacillus sp. YPD9-1]